MYIITVNPLNNIVSREPRLSWLCKHPNAVVIDNKNLLYYCYICLSTAHVKVIPATRNTSYSPHQPQPPPSLL